jgi:hypothetical protein
MYMQFMRELIRDKSDLMGYSMIATQMLELWKQKEGKLNKMISITSSTTKLTATTTTTTTTIEEEEEQEQPAGEQQTTDNE